MAIVRGPLIPHANERISAELIVYLGDSRFIEVLPSRHT